MRPHASMHCAGAYTDGYEHFAVIHVEVTRLDWLWVGAEDLRRASFAWNGSAWAGAWTVP